MTNKEIMGALVDMNKEELKLLNKEVVNRINLLNRKEAESIKYKIKVGEIVNIKHKAHKQDKFEVRKINRKRAVLRQVGTSQDYAVPLHLIITK